MTTRKKLIISLTTLSLAIIAVFSITFGVLAAQTQSVKNIFSVNYAADNVAATVAAKYQVKNGSSTYLTGGNVTYDNTANAGYRFQPGDDNTNPATLSASGANVTLTATDNYVIFTYIFQNDNSTGGRAMTVTLTDSAVKTNVNCYYLASAEANKGYNDIYYSTYDAQDETNNVVRTEGQVPSTQTVNAQGTVYFYVLVEIDDDTLDASYVSTYAPNAEPAVTTCVSWSLAAVVA